MSVKWMSWAWEVEVPTSDRVGETHCRIVLVKLADNANDEGICWPSLDRIAEQTGLHRASVIRAVNLLEENGLLTRRHRHDETGRQQSNLYHLYGGGSPQATLPYDQGEGRHRRPPRVATGDGGGSPQATQNRKKEPSEEPSLGPSAQNVLQLPLTQHETHPDGREANAHDLVAVYVDLVQSKGAKRDARMVGQIARQVQGLLKSGHEPEAIERGIRRYVAELSKGARLTARHLPDLVVQCELERTKREEPPREPDPPRDPDALVHLQELRKRLRDA